MLFFKKKNICASDKDLVNIYDNKSCKINAYE